MKPPVDYHYGSALDSFGVHHGASRPSAAHWSGGNSPMNSLGLRTDSMLDRLDLLDTVADFTAARASSDGWLDFPPPLFTRHPEGEEEEPAEEGLEDEESLDEEDFDEEDEDFDDEDFDDEDDEELDEELDEEIDDIDIDEEDDDFDEDEDLDELDDDEDEDLDDI
jgi:hypothetical protein